MKEAPQLSKVVVNGSSREDCRNYLGQKYEIE